MDTKYLLSFLVIFLIVFLGDLLFVVRPAILKITGKKKSKKTKKKEKPLMEIEYLCNKFKLNRNKLNYNEFMFTFPLINSFIITIVTLILELIRIPFIFRLLIGFVLLLGLIYAIYEIYGNRLKRKEKEN
jgi:hypothetical protein